MQVRLVEFCCTVISFVVTVHFIKLSKHAYTTAFMLPFVYYYTFLSKQFLWEVCFECQDTMPFKIRYTESCQIIQGWRELQLGMFFRMVYWLCSLECPMAHMWSTDRPQTCKSGCHLLLVDPSDTIFMMDVGFIAMMEFPYMNYWIRRSLTLWINMLISSVVPTAETANRTGVCNDSLSL